MHTKNDEKKKKKFYTVGRVHIIASEKKLYIYYASYFHKMEKTYRMLRHIQVRSGGIYCFGYKKIWNYSGKLKHKDFCAFFNLKEFAVRCFVRYSNIRSINVDDYICNEYNRRIVQVIGNRQIDIKKKILKKGISISNALHFALKVEIFQDLIL